MPTGLSNCSPSLILSTEDALMKGTFYGTGGGCLFAQSFRRFSEIDLSRKMDLGAFGGTTEESPLEEQAVRLF